MTNYKLHNWLSKLTGAPQEVWFQRLAMIGPKIGRSYSKEGAGPWAYFGLMFYWFAICWNNVDPDMWYGGQQPIPWHGFTFLWGPNCPGEPGALLWNNRKRVLLWR